MHVQSCCFANPNAFFSVFVTVAHFQQIKELYRCCLSSLLLSPRNVVTVETCAVQATTRTGYMMTSPKFSTWRQNQETRIRVAFQLSVQRLETLFQGYMLLPFPTVPQELRYGGEYWTRMELNTFISNRKDNLAATGTIQQHTVRCRGMSDTITRCIGYGISVHREVCCFAGYVTTWYDIMHDAV